MTTTRETSLKAYQSLVDSGQLAGNQARIAQAVIKLPDCTSGEVCAALDIKNVNAWRARFTELQERGLIAESGQRKCKITGRTGVTWRYTNRAFPLDMKKRASKHELRALLKRSLPFIESAPGAEDIRDKIREALR